MALVDNLATEKQKLTSLLESEYQAQSFRDNVLLRLLIVRFLLGELVGSGGSGGGTGDASAINQTSVQSLVGAIPSKVLGVQGVVGGVPVPVVANAGTNLNTSALATESGGNLAAINLKLPSSLGAKTAVNSVSFVPATDAIFATTGETGLLSFRNTSLTNTASQIKATAGQTRGWNLINPNTVPVYIKFYDALAANVVVGTTAVLRTLAIPSGGAFYLEAQSVSQDDFLTAISIACVTGLLDSNATAPAIAIHAEMRYK